DVHIAEAALNNVDMWESLQV
ncbi:unnamed protein product, partial [Allacma fusca]